MSVVISDLQVLHEYINGVMGRSDHHAFDVNEIALAIAGGVAWRADEIRALERNGEMKNVVWFAINGVWYALSYQHTPAQIKLLQGSLQGAIIATFTNATPIADVKNIFHNL